MMNSILTMEERTLLQSLGCADREQTISVLEQMMMPIPVRSELFAAVLMLKCKLEREQVDFSFEMAATDTLGEVEN